MTVFDFLESPIGVQLVHAVIVLILAIAAWFSYMAKRQSDQNAKLLNGHLQAHVDAQVAAQTADEPGHTGGPPNHT